MLHLEEAVRMVCDQNQFKWQYNDIDNDKCVQGMRQPILNKCRLSGNNVSVAAVDLAIAMEAFYRNQNRIGAREEEGFFLKKPILVDSPCTEITIGRQWGEPIPPLVSGGVQSLNNVPRIILPWLVNVAEEARELMTPKEGAKFLPGYFFDQIVSIGPDPHYLLRDNVEYAGRFHGQDGYNKVYRAISCPPQSRKMTKRGLAIMKKYVHKDLGISRAVQERILAEPAKWVASQKKPASAMLIVSSVYGWYLAETTGWCPLGIRRDMSASGYSIQLWLLRLNELFVRICTNSGIFRPAHNDMVTAMQDGAWARGRWSALSGIDPNALIAVAKAAFMVCMYTGGYLAIFEGLTGEERHHDPSDVVRYVLPQVLEEEYFGGLCNEVIYHDLLKLCKDLAKAFSSTFGASKVFERYWTKKWDDNKPEKEGQYFEGYRLPYPLGGEVLVPYLGMSKKHRVSRQVNWIETLPDGELFKRGFSVTVMKETWNEFAAVLVTGVCRMMDSAILYNGAVRNTHNSSYADHGMILDSTHDEIEFHPNDEHKVQENMTQGANEVFEFDLMETGKDPLYLNKGTHIFR